MASVRLTGNSCSPSFSVATQVASRVALILRASLSSASSQPISTQRSDPGARYFGVVRRSFESCVANAAAPLAQSEPSFTTPSGSPSRLTSLPSMTWPTIAQPQEQKLQTVVNSLAPASLISAARDGCGARRVSKVTLAAPPVARTFNKSLRPTVMVVPPRPSPDVGSRRHRGRPQAQRSRGSQASKLDQVLRAGARFSVLGRHHRGERVVELGRVLVEHETHVTGVTILAELLLLPVGQRRHVRVVVAAEAAGVLQPLGLVTGVRVVLV